MRVFLLSLLLCSAISGCTLPDYDVETLRNEPDGGIDHTMHGNGGGGGAAGSGESSITPLDGGALAAELARENQCSEYCDLFAANCASMLAANYGSRDDCVLTCGEADWPLGDSISTPNSVRCRREHALYARTLGNAPLHCGHAARDPIPSCPP